MSQEVPGWRNEPLSDEEYHELNKTLKEISPFFNSILSGENIIDNIQMLTGYAYGEMMRLVEKYREDHPGIKADEFDQLKKWVESMSRG